MSRTRRPGRFLHILLCVPLVAALLAACTEHAEATKPEDGTPSRSQLVEARRLINPNNEGGQVRDSDVDCVARTVVMNPNVDEIAEDMAQIPDKDLRELVMIDYLTCAYNFVLNFYMRFAPHGLAPSELSCIRSKFTELTIKRLAEVIVLDPDAGYTGPLVIASCKSHSPGNPLVNGTIPDMGGS